MSSSRYDDDDISVNTRLPEYASYTGTLETVTRPPTYLSNSPDGGPRRSRNSFQSSYYPQQGRGAPYQLTLPVQETKGGNGKKPWLTWQIADPRRSSGRAPKYPTFVGGENVKGLVRLELDGSVKITTISLHLAGTIVTKGQISRIAAVPAFLNFTHSIWPPMVPSAEIKSKPCGDFDIKFDFPFPADVDVSQSLSQNKVKNGISAFPIRCATPPTLQEPGATIHYTLSLVVGHGRFHSNSVVKTPVVFIPCTTPLPPSDLRQQAYKQVIPPPLPNNDPSGWLSLPRVRVKGVTPSDQMPIEVAYNLSLAAPASYTRGTAIPCHLSIHTDTPSCLRKISIPQHQSVCLNRKIEVIENWHDEFWHNEFSNFHPRDVKQLYEDEIARCVFWMRKEVGAIGEIVDVAGWSSVELEGEIYLEKSLLPSFAFPVMFVEYSVQIRPCARSAFLVQSFETDSSGETQFAQQPDQPLSDLTVLASIPVSVTTIRPPGPRQPLYARSQAIEGLLRDQTIMEEEQEGGSQRVAQPDRKKKIEKYHGTRHAPHAQPPNPSGTKRVTQQPNQPLSKPELLATIRPPVPRQPLFARFQARKGRPRDQATVEEEQGVDSQRVGQPDRKKKIENLKYHGTRYA